MRESEHKPYYLWLDDCRPVPELPELPLNWVLAKDLEEFKDIITENGLPVYVSFDHDLNEEHYSGNYRDTATGLDAVEWMIKYIKSNKLECPLWSVHTLNYNRGQDMRHLLMLCNATKKLNHWKELPLNHDRIKGTETS